jgi:hypothetical protein
VSPSEFVFLACGLTLGLFAGGALIEVFRARPAAQREVRVTVSAGPVGGRAATLATPLLASELVHGRDDVFAPEAGATERPFGPATREPTREPTRRLGSTLAPAFGSGPGTAHAEPVDPCAAERAGTDEACAHADRMAAVAGAAQERARDARRAYDEHAGRRDRAAAAVDPRAIRAAKDEAQAHFRRGRLAGQDRAAVEAAAAAWLREINRINARSREAALVMRAKPASRSSSSGQSRRRAWTSMSRGSAASTRPKRAGTRGSRWPAARRPSALGRPLASSSPRGRRHSWRRGTRRPRN